MEKSRQESRKEARLAKKSNKHQLWLNHKRDEKLKKNGKQLKSKVVNPSMCLTQNVSERRLECYFGRQPILKQSKAVEEVDTKQSKAVKEVDPKKYKAVKKVESEMFSSGHDSKAPRMVKRQKVLKRNKKKTGFEKFLEMEMKNAGVISAIDDLELERKLAKKLKVKKDGKLRGDDDGINSFFEGSTFDLDYSDDSSVKKSEKSLSNKRKTIKLSDQAIDGEMPSDFMNEEVDVNVSSRQNHKKRKLIKEEEAIKADDMATDISKPMEGVATKAPEKYVAPHLRSRAGNELEEHSQIRRQVRGLLNRLSESNIESMTGEMSVIFRSVARGIASHIICEEVLASCSTGPRGNEQYAAVFAAFVAGMACSVGVDFSAKLMASLAKMFEVEYLKEDNLSLRNLTLLLSYLCVFGVCSSDLIYDFMTMLSKRLTEVDVSTILTVLQCCGMKIRADDPLSMKNFIVSVQSRVNELKASSKGGQENVNGKRMEFMLETICDIKNNKKRPKEDPAHHTRIKKWLQKLRVEEILIRGLNWSKLLDPDKKGQWWSSSDMAITRDDVEDIANTIDKEVLEAQKMLQLAAAQRMNTEARKAIFCIIMSGEDYIDTFEKLLRLDLPGKQDREIMRVLLECCLQEKVFNKYYVVLASKLCEHEKNHKFTLQFCLWDQFKELESMQLIRSMNLARFVAEMIASFTLSIAVLKAVDMNDVSKLTPKRIMHFRMLFESLFEYSDKTIWNVFTRVAVAPELESLRHGIEFFVKQYVLRTNKAVSEKFKIVRKALNNTEGILM
ncbi:hypothetical protein UlMin_019304 [Ulmus minor]